MAVKCIECGTAHTCAPIVAGQVNPITGRSYPLALTDNARGFKRFADAGAYEARVFQPSDSTVLDLTNHNHAPGASDQRVLYRVQISGQLDRYFYLNNFDACQGTYSNLPLNSIEAIDVLRY